MSIAERGSGSPPETEPSFISRASANTPGPRQLLRRAERSFGRLKAFRYLLLSVAGLLSVIVFWSIWTRRPARTVPGSRSTTSTPSSGAVQTIERFEYTSTVAGERAYTIVADKLTGIEGGVHTLEGIRSIEILRPDGKTLRGSAERGRFTADEGSSEGGPAGGIVVLEGNVRVEGPNSEWFESDRIEFSRASRKLVSPGGAQFRLEMGEGESGHLEYDLSSQRARLEKGVVLHLKPSGSDDAPAVLVRADTAVSSEGGRSVDLSGAVSVERDGDRLRAPEMHIEWTGPGAVTRTLSATRAQGRFLPRPETSEGGERKPSMAPSGTPDVRRMLTVQSPVLISANRLEMHDRTDTRQSVLRLIGTASVEEETPKGGGSQPRSLKAHEIVIRNDGPGQPRRIHAEGEVRLVFPPGQRETAPRTLSCRKLDAVSDSGGVLATADAEGDVRIHAGSRSASAERARLLGESRVELRGGRPRIAEPERILVADELDVQDDPEQLTGRGKVRTRFLSGSETETGPFTQGTAVDISSDAIIVRQASNSAEFTGDVLATQPGQALSAQALFLDHAQQTARATGSVRVRAHRLEGPSTKVSSEIGSDSLFHDARRKTSRFEGHAFYREPGRRLSADTITTAGGDVRGRTEITAEGNVAFEGEGKRGTADFAKYRSADRTIMLEGRERLATVLDLAARQSWRGPALTWAVTPGSIPTVTGESGRSKVVGSPVKPRPGSLATQD